MIRFFTICLLIIFISNNQDIYAQNTQLDTNCRELALQLNSDADKGIYYLYFSSGGMIPRSKCQTKKEAKFFSRYKHIKLVNGGCALPPCTYLYNTEKYDKCRTDFLDKKYGKKWRKDFPKHLGQITTKSK